MASQDDDFYEPPKDNNDVLAMFETPKVARRKPKTPPPQLSEKERKQKEMEEIYGKPERSFKKTTDKRKLNLRKEMEKVKDFKIKPTIKEMEGEGVVGTAISSLGIQEIILASRPYHLTNIIEFSSEMVERMGQDKDNFALKRGIITESLEKLDWVAVRTRNGTVLYFLVPKDPAERDRVIGLFRSNEQFRADLGLERRGGGISKAMIKDIIKEVLLELNKETKGGVIKMLKHKKGAGVFDSFANLDPSKLAEYGQKGVKALTGVDLPFSKVVDTTLDIFGKPSAFQKSVASHQKISAYGDTLLEVIAKYGADSQQAKDFRLTFPERTYMGTYVYKTPDDESSGFLYPKQYQDLANYENAISNAGVHGQKFVDQASNFANSIGIDYNDSNTDSIVRKVFNAQKNLGLYGHY